MSIYTVTLLFFSSSNSFHSPEFLCFRNRNYGHSQWHEWTKRKPTYFHYSLPQKSWCLTNIFMDFLNFFWCVADHHLNNSHFIKFFNLGLIVENIHAWPANTVYQFYTISLLSRIFKNFVDKSCIYGMELFIIFCSFFMTSVANLFFLYLVSTLSKNCFE